MPSAVSLTSGSLNFGALTVGFPSSQEAVTLTNGGSTPVAFTSPTISGVNAADFLLYSPACVQPPCGWCLLLVLHQLYSGGFRHAKRLFPSE